LNAKLRDKYIEMPLAAWKRWDKALRSGKYKQGKKVLYNEKTEGYCCLGVMEEVIAGKVEVASNGCPLSFPSGEWLDKHDVKFYDEDGEKSMVPWLPLLKKHADAANDSGVKFNRIADAILHTVLFVQ